MNKKLRRIIAIIALVFVGICTVSIVLTMANSNLLNGQIGFLTLYTGGIGLALFAVIKISDYRFKRSGQGQNDNSDNQSTQSDSKTAALSEKPETATEDPKLVAEKDKVSAKNSNTAVKTSKTVIDDKDSLADDPKDSGG